MKERESLKREERITENHRSQITTEKERERKKEAIHRERSDYVGRVPIERKLARVPTPRVFPREPKSLLQANITIDHRSQITKKGEKG